MSPVAVIAHAYETGGFTTRSDYFRAHSEAVAEAACLGLITTQRLDGTFGKIWRPSPLGLSLLFKALPSHETLVSRLGAAGARDGTGDSCLLFSPKYSG